MRLSHWLKIGVRGLKLATRSAILFFLAFLRIAIPILFVVISVSQELVVAVFLLLTLLYLLFLFVMTWASWYEEDLLRRPPKT